MNWDIKATKPQEAVPLPVIVKRIKAAVAEVPAGWVEAEINQVTPKNGHFWFELAGGEDTVKGVMWRRDAERVTRQLPDKLAKGQKIHARYDRVDFYGPHGALRIVISQIRFVGEGELLRRRTESLERLKREGLCDKKRPLPEIPRCIGLIAGKSSDGQIDVVEAITSRWPPAKIKFVPSLVQGARAPEQLISSLLTLEADAEVDVIALCRGGGSVQDLLAFDDEELCRIIANIETPVVAAIGHTRNRPNAYYVADAEAPVPQAAAELLVPSKAEHLHSFDQALRLINRELKQTGARTALIDNLQKRLRRFLDVDPRRSRLKRLGTELQIRGSEGLRAGASILDRARRAIEVTSRSIPPPQVLDSPAARLFSVVMRNMQLEREELSRASQFIPKALTDIPAPSTLDAQAARLRNATHHGYKGQRNQVDGLAVLLAGDLRRAKQGATTAKDQVGSLRNRLIDSAGRAITQGRLALAAEEQEILTSARRRLNDFGERVILCSRQIDALDPSTRGFALLRTEQGAIVDSAAELREGDAVRLELHDGSADARIETLTTSDEGKK